MHRDRARARARRSVAGSKARFQLAQWCRTSSVHYLNLPSASILDHLLWPSLITNNL